MVQVSEAAVGAPAVTVRRIQNARDWPAGIVPSARPAAFVAHRANVTPAGALFSLATVCSVPLIALVPRPSSTVVEPLGVFAVSQATAFAIGLALLLCTYAQRYSTSPAAASAPATESNRDADAMELDLTPPNEAAAEVFEAPPDRRY